MRITIITLLILSLNGCATAVSMQGRFKKDSELPVFPATRMDAAAIYFGSTGDTKMIPKRNPFIVLGGLVDLPFSLVSDILFLPYDGFREAARNNTSENKQPEAPQTHEIN